MGIIGGEHRDPGMTALGVVPGEEGLTEHDRGSDVCKAPGEAGVVRTTSDAVHGREAARQRLGLKGRWRVVAGGGGEFVPRREIGVRHDGGNAEAGFGVDIGGGVVWLDRASGITAEMSGRGLLTQHPAGSGNTDLRIR